MPKNGSRANGDRIRAAERRARATVVGGSRAFAESPRNTLVSIAREFAAAARGVDTIALDLHRAVKHPRMRKRGLASRPPTTARRVRAPRKVVFSSDDDGGETHRFQEMAQ